MTTQPKVSVIIPVYGVEKYLKQCLDSVINQTLKDIEIIVIDDGGKDKCPQIIDEYAAKDNRIKAIHKENGGYGHTCNRGLEVATGEYIAIVEPDDFIDLTMYEDLYELAIKNNSDIVKSAYWEYYDNPEIEDYTEPFFKYVGWATSIHTPKTVFQITEYPNLLYHHPSIWSCIYRLEFLKRHNICFIEAKGGGWVDNPFQIETMGLAEKIVWTPKAYYNYRPDSIGNSSKLKDYNIPVSRMNDIHDFFDKYPNIYEKVFYYFTKKEISYLYNAYKVGFKNLSGIDEIHEMKDKLIKTLNRIPEKYYKKYKFRKYERRNIQKMKTSSYSLKYYYNKLKQGVKNENSVL